MIPGRHSTSIAQKIQIQIGLVIAVVIAAVTLLAYQHSITRMREDALSDLLASVSLRSVHDSSAFVDAQQNATALRDEYLRRLKAMGQEDPKSEFDAWFVRSPDGLIRVRPERDDFKHLPTLYIRATVTLTPEVRRHVVAAFRVLREWGPALTQRYYSAYIDLPGVSLIMFSPSVNWGKEADTTTNNFDYPPVQASSPARNPQRKNLWTDVYYDDKALIWMVSTITPADKDGQWVGTVSQDMAVDELVKRTVNDSIPGTYNVILNEDGQLLAHPQRMAEIIKAGGKLDPNTTDDPLLQGVATLAKSVGMSPAIHESPDGRHYLGFARIRGPNWHAVTVYPKTLLRQRAFESARVILLGGLVGLAIELALLAWIIRRHVAVPLGKLNAAAESVANGDLQVQLEGGGNHELGRLAISFMHMASKLRARDEALNTRASELEFEVAERKLSEQRMHHMATHDALTGLANRTLLIDRLQQAIVAAQRSPQTIAVLFIDLDHFKQINDTLGHDIGDEVLRRVAAQISQLLRKSDTLCRLGGDEFVLLLPAVARKEDALVIAEKIIGLLSVPMVLGGTEFSVTPSMGISSFPQDGQDAETLLKNADIAMYRAKESGRNAFQFYTPDMGVRASEVLRMEAAIRYALEHHELELHFQPKVQASTRTIVGAEALVRWNRPGHGLLVPAAFIPFAEERNLMQLIDPYVLRLACEHLSRWTLAGSAVSLAVNLSASHFGRSSFPQELAELLKLHGLDASWLTLEVTEGVLLSDGGDVPRNMLALREMGVQLSIDDFGTGYSSLSYLHRFQVDELKIDRTFISKIGRSDKDASLVKSIIGIGHDLDLDVVGEGVETIEQVEFLTQRGCDVLQGYFFYLPMPEDQFLEMLSAERFAAG